MKRTKFAGIIPHKANNMLLTSANIVQCRQCLQIAQLEVGRTTNGLLDVPMSSIKNYPSNVSEDAFVVPDG
jgi:hypothetical protein